MYLPLPTPAENLKFTFKMLSQTNPESGTVSTTEGEGARKKKELSKWLHAEGQNR